MRKPIAAAAAILLLGVLHQAARAGDTLEEVKRRGVLVVGVKNTMPPFGFTDRATGETVGIDIDLTRAIADRLNVKLQLKLVASSERIPALLDGSVDLIAGAIPITPERAKVVDFTTAYFSANQRILARTGAVATLKDLDGKKIGTVKGATTELNVRTLIPTAKAVSFADIRSALDALRKGEVDAVSGYGLILYGLLATLPKDEYEIPASIRIAEERFGLAVRKGDRTLLEAVNGALAGLDASGDAKKIYDKWLQRRGAGGSVPEAPKGLQASGVIVRPAATVGRFIAVATSGTFWMDADISIFDPQGNFVGKGRVKSIYEDEVYLDDTDVPKGLIQPGFSIRMNFTNEEAKKDILAHQEVIQGVKQGAKQDEAERQREIAADARKEKEDRARWQEDMTKTRMVLDYQYENYYWGGPYWW